MFRNFVNVHDATWLLRAILTGRGVTRPLRKLFSGSRARVEDAWAHTESPPTSWWDIPAVRARWNEKLTGDAELTWPVHVAGTRFSACAEDGQKIRGVSLGCGNGEREAAWARTGIFETLEAWDLSPPRIARARKRAEDEGLSEVLDFHVGDVATVLDGESRYDLVVCEHALHHFTPLAEIIPGIAGVLKPGGFLAIDDFVGPSRYQWTDRQIDAINHVLETLPERYRTLWESDELKKPIFRPSLLRMRLLDPSEAAESSDILPLVRDHFDVVEIRPYGGSLLHFLLSGISHHFADDDPLAARVLHACFEIEDALLESGELASDFCGLVATPKAD